MHRGKPGLRLADVLMYAQGLKMDVEAVYTKFAFATAAVSSKRCALKQMM